MIFSGEGVSRPRQAGLQVHRAVAQEKAARETREATSTTAATASASTATSLPSPPSATTSQSGRVRERRGSGSSASSRYGLRGGVERFENGAPGCDPATKPTTSTSCDDGNGGGMGRAPRPGRAGYQGPRCEV